MLLRGYGARVFEQVQATGAAGDASVDDHMVNKGYIGCMV